MKSTKVGILTKVCGHCKIEKPLTDFYQRREINGYMSKCKKCNNSIFIKYQKKRYYEDDEFRQASIDRIAAWRKKHYKKWLSYFLVYAKRRRDLLSDAYMKELLVKKTYLSRHDIPLGLIMAKRQALKIKREVSNGKYK